MSIELCDTNGHEAASIIGGKLRDETLPVSIGGEVLRTIQSIDHYGDGLLVVAYTGESAETSEVFQFSPDFRPFSDTAINNDGVKVCDDC